MPGYKLHIGCGKRYIPGFIHVDVVPQDHLQVLADVSKLPFRYDSVDLIYACHVLEHFGRHAIHDVLLDWNHALRLGGILRISVPNMEAIAAQYYLTEDLEPLISLIMGDQKDRFNHHGMIFDYFVLRDHLRRAGFRLVRWYDWRKTEHSEYDDYSQAYLPHMDKAHGRLMSLNVEAVA